MPNGPDGRFVSRPAGERFWEKVERRGDNECWLWLGSQVLGYGVFKKTPAKQVRAHRFGYELLVGPIPEGLTLDHLCGVRLCVNPAHLEPVTTGENSLRGNGPPAVNARKTHCKNGHPLPPWKLGVERICRICRATAKREREWKKRRDDGRPVGGGAHNRIKTHCIHGHPFDEVNTKVRPDGYRECRECKRTSNRERGRRIRAEGRISRPVR